MRERKCVNCGAPIPASQTGPILTCAFCAAEFHVDEPTPTPAPTARTEAAPANPAVTVGCLVLLASGLAGAGLLAGGYFATGPTNTNTTTPTTTTPPPPHQPPEPTGIPLSQLPTVEGGGGWFEVEAPGMVGTYEDFDLIGNLEWLTGIARAWSPDAEMHRLSVDGVHREGHLDLSSREDFELDMRLHSPALRESARTAAMVSEKKVYSEFRIGISQRKVVAYLDTHSRHPGDADEVPPAPIVPACSLDDAMSAWRELGLPMRPHYSVLVQRLDGRSSPRHSRPGYWRMGVGADTRFDHGEHPPYLDPTTCKPLK